MLALLWLGCAPGWLRAQVSVTTYHNDVARTGQNSQETILTPSNVAGGQFGRLFTVALDGFAVAQPLYLPAVSIAGGTHNVLYVATEHDSLYALDADTGSVYRQISLIPAGGRTLVPADFGGCADIVPEVGITGTPVIDPVSGTLYVVAKSYVNGSYVQYLHAIDVTSFEEKFGGPTLIQATVPGAGYDAVGGVVSFDALTQNQRAALLLVNGHVVIGWSSHCDNDPWHGWLMSYAAGSLTREAVLNTSPNGRRGGIWMSGGGPAADANGDIFFPTGNGTWNGTSDFGDSIVELGPLVNGAWPVVDYFTPHDQSTLNQHDNDVASGGLVLLPPVASGRLLLAQQGKAGTIYLLDRTNLGGYCVAEIPACSGSDPQIVQEIVGASAGVWGSPAYWNGNLYWAGSNDPITAYSIDANGSGKLSTSPTSHTPQIFAFTAPIPSVSANGNLDGIVWAMDGSSENSVCLAGKNCLGLYAYDATNLSHVLYESTKAAGNRDSPGSAVKYGTPTIANGKVYVGAQYAVSVYGLFGPALAPSVSPPPGPYSGAQFVTLTDATPAATIHYTVDGTTPTPASPVYGAPLLISTTTTVQALAVAAGHPNSAVTSATYTIAPGNGPTAVNLAPSDNVVAIAAAGAPVPGGGLDGSGGAYAQNFIGASLTWAGATYSFGAAGVSDAASGAIIALPAANAAAVSLLATAVNGNQPNQKFVVTYTDGTTASFTQSVSDWHTPQAYPGESTVLTMPYRLTSTGATHAGTYNLYGYAFAVNAAKTIRSLTLPANRNVVVLAVDVAATAGALPPAAGPGFSPAPGPYPGPQAVMLTDATPGAVIYYTTTGSPPTVNSSRYISGTPVEIAATATIQAMAAAAGYQNSSVTSATYTIATSSVPQPVSLAAVGNVVAVAASGSPVPHGGLDGSGDAFAENLVGTALNWAGAGFTLGAAGTYNGVSGGTLPLPAGNDATLSLLATAVHGNQTNQTFVVTYTDGSSSTFSQSLSDWHTPQAFPGESAVLTMPYRVTGTGATQSEAFVLYGYAFALNAAKTVRSFALPANRNVVVLAVDVAP